MNSGSDTTKMELGKCTKALFMNLEWNIIKWNRINAPTFLKLESNPTKMYLVLFTSLRTHFVPLNQLDFYTAIFVLFHQ